MFLLCSHMNDAAFNPTANGHVQELDALDKAAGEAAPELEAREARLGMQLDRLARLADMGMELAEGLTRKAARIEAEETAPGYEGVCLAFTRITRAIRQINAQEQEILGLCEQTRRAARQDRAEAGKRFGARDRSVRRRSAWARSALSGWVRARGPHLTLPLRGPLPLPPPPEAALCVTQKATSGRGGEGPNPHVPSPPFRGERVRVRWASAGKPEKAT
jgi:hypothetical protein